MNTTDIQALRDYYLERYAWYLREIGREMADEAGWPHSTDEGRLMLLRAQALEISELREALWRGNC